RLNKGMLPFFRANELSAGWRYTTARLFEGKAEGRVMREEVSQGFLYTFVNFIGRLEGGENCNMRRHPFSRRGIVPLAECLYESFRFGDENYESSSFLRAHIWMPVLLHP